MRSLVTRHASDESWKENAGMTHVHGDRLRLSVGLNDALRDAAFSAFAGQCREALREKKDVFGVSERREAIDQVDCLFRRPTRKCDPTAQFLIFVTDSRLRGHLRNHDQSD